MSISASPSSVLLSDSISRSENNNFNLIRLFAAILVILTHSYESTIDPVTFITNHLFSGAYLGVCTFFFLSGLLIAQSLRRSSSWRNYLWHRFLRLYPAACLVVLVCAFLIGPLATALPLRDYFTDPRFYRFLSSCCLFRIHFSLPGVWEHAKDGPDLISPFWSLALELKLYIGLLLFSFLKLPGKRIMAICFVLSCFLFHLFFYSRTGIVGSVKLGSSGFTFNFVSYTVLAPLFVLGAFLESYRDRIRIQPRWVWALAALLLIAFFAKIRPLATFVCFPGLFLYIATNRAGWLKRITPGADISYGVYLFGGPIGKVVSIYLHPPADGYNFLLTMLLVIPLALLSWYGLEKKMQRFKDGVH